MTPRSAATSVAEMLQEKKFGRISNVSDLRFLVLASHLACSTEQQGAFHSQSWEELGDRL